MLSSNGFRPFGWLALAVALMAGCGKRQVADKRVEVVFWHTQAGHNAKVLAEKIVKPFNERHPNIRVKTVYYGSYSDLFKKTMVAVKTTPPALAVAYESMVAEYMKAGVIAPLDEYLNHPDYGLSKESQADIFPAYLATNTFAQFDNKLLSFPFTKSNLMMYYNIDLLEAAGIERPPETWEEFLEQCRIVKDKLGKKGYALSVDASTVDGMVFTCGGDVLSEDRSRTLFGEEPGVRALKVIETLIKEGLAYQIQYRSRDDRLDLAHGRCAFMLRSSTTRPYLTERVDELASESGTRTRWGMSIIPRGKGCEKVTVMFGANICMFKTTPEKQQAAWEFIKYFTSKEVTALWATETGYLPVRKSAAETERLKAFFAANDVNRVAFDVLPYAKPEPNVAGWQQVRDLIEEAEVAIISGKKTAEQAAKDLAALADQALAR